MSKTMCYRTNCPCCQCASTELLGYGVVAPWIVKLINGADPVKTQLRLCSQCGLRFFSYRYSPSEMALICGEYRSDYFFKLRHHWEPWVNRQVNDAFSDELANKRQIEIRNVFTTSSLTEAGIDLNELKGCIDFGGDLGQFIPDAIKPPLVVYEPTGTRRGLRPNVIGCEKLSELVDKVDLGLNCYVLKHIDEPWHAVSERDLPCRIVGPLENADVITTNTFWIGVYPGLDKHQIDFTTESIHKFMKSN